MPKHLVTKESLQQMIDDGLQKPCTVATRDGIIVNTTFGERIVGKALLVLFARQTELEKKANDTRDDNGVGFTGADGKAGVLSAKSFIKHNTLQQWQLDRWTKKNPRGYSRITKYWRQLDEAAQLKARSRTGTD